MIQNNLIHEGERLDELQRNGYGIIQNPGYYPVLRKQRQGKKYWILEPVPELFRF